MEYLEEKDRLRDALHARFGNAARLQRASWDEKPQHTVANTMASKRGANSESYGQFYSIPIGEDRLEDCSAPRVATKRIHQIF